jgi:hypothetical protein
MLVQHAWTASKITYPQSCCCSIYTHDLKVISFQDQGLGNNMQIQHHFFINAGELQKHIKNTNYPLNFIKIPAD